MISVIIPFFNSDQTLKECLDSVFSNKFENYEVITVSDKSTDNSINIVKNYNCKIIELDENKGPAFARNTGANSASGEVLFFLDSDCILKNDALTNIDRIFKKKITNVVQGIYSHEPNYNNLATQYQQSFYCYYSFSKYLTHTNCLISMCFAIEKKIFIESKGFNTSIKNATAEDEEFGHVLIGNGNKILIARELTVEHRVNYSLTKFIKRSFIMYVDTIRSFIRNRTYTNKVKQKNYFNVLAGMPILGLIILLLPIIIFFPSSTNMYFFLTLNIFFLLLHIRFINFIKKSKGLSQASKIIPICYLDTLLMLCGTLYGFFIYFLGKRY